MHQITLSDGLSKITDTLINKTKEEHIFDCICATQSVNDIVLNAWVARDIIKKLLIGLEKKRFSREKLGKLQFLIIELLRKWLAEGRDRMAEELFRSEVLEV